MHKRTRNATVYCLALLLLLGACSGRTWYAVDIDVLSYLPSEERSRELAFELPEEFYLYLLPYLDDLVTDPGLVEAVYANGVEVELDTPEAPDDGDIVLEFTVDTEIENVGSSGMVEVVRFGLFMAPLETEDIYFDEHRVVAFEVTDLQPGEFVRLGGTKRVEPGDPGYSLLATGSFRLGARAYFRGAAASGIAYSMEEIGVKMSLRPFSLLP